MKHVKLFEQFVNKTVNESAGYILKDDSGQGKPTMVLKLEPEAWEKVKHLFDKEGRPDDVAIKRMPAGGYAWDLYASEYTQGGKVMHKIYGVSGDYTFGNAPMFYQQKYRGNKKAAKEVFNAFVNKFLN